MTNINILVLIACLIIALCGIYAMMLTEENEELKSDEYDEKNFPIDSEVKTTSIDEDYKKELKYFKWLRNEENEKKR